MITGCFAITNLYPVECSFAAPFGDSTWETELSELIGKDVDLIIFGQSGALLRHQILKYGKLLYEKDFHARVEQEVRARAEYLDTRCLYQKLAA
jgi:hypothetical protein